MAVSAPPFSCVLFAVCLLFIILSSVSSGFTSNPSRNVLLTASFTEKTSFLGFCHSPPSSFASSSCHHQLSLFASSKTDNDDTGDNNDSYGTSSDDKATFSFSSPLDRPWQAAVDAAALVTFAAVGKANHNPDGSVDGLLAVVMTAAPFLLAWFATSPFTNVYSKTGKSLQESFLQVVPGWAIAVPLGCILRGIIKGNVVPPLAFVLVTLIATLVLLGLGRVLYNVIEDVFVELV